MLEPISLDRCRWLPDRDDWGVGIILTTRPDVATGFAAVVIVGCVPAGIGQQPPTLQTVRTEAMGHSGAGSYIKSASQCESGGKDSKRRGERTRLTGCPYAAPSARWHSAAIAATVGERNKNWMGIST